MFLFHENTLSMFAVVKKMVKMLVIATDIYGVLSQHMQ